MLSDESTAICFFLTSIVGLGRGFKSTQGFLEPLLPVVANEHPSSVLSIVVSAVSTKIWGCWKNPLRSYESPHSPFTRALVHLQAALNDPVERSKDSTVLSIILMHFYEGVATRSMHRASIRAHRDGACALLKQQANSVPQSECCAFLKNYLRHCDVSAYLESQASDTSDLDIWFDKDWDENMPVNPNTVLDLIGLALAHLQTRLSDMKRCVKHNPYDSGIETWWQDLESVEVQLSEWTLLVPTEWQPYTRAMHDGFSYLGSCDLYPTVQIATMWNVWRICRLTVLRLRLSLLACVPPGALRRFKSLGAKKQIFFDPTSGKEVVDSICRSIPFYLGTRRSHGGLNDLIDSEIKVPSYHDRDLNSDVRARYLQGDDAMSVVDYRRHILVQGPSHALLHLNSLIKVLSSEGGDVICRAISADQVIWIREQFLRVCKLTNAHF
ncbi:hypothetical protein K4F52_004347 [Lecanicillium sp. MT-2017a]|nr:hypothetical protein K4F52_004347 [Lecanicillium sp. MT-2017a]